MVRPPASPIDPDTGAVDARRSDAQRQPYAATGAPVPGDSVTSDARPDAMVVPPRRHPLAPKQYLWIVGALLVVGLAGGGAWASLRWMSKGRKDTEE